MASVTREDLRRESAGELVKRLSRQLGVLVRQEAELAKQELTEKAARAGVGAGLLGGAAVVGLAALGALTAALVLVLDLGLPAWAAALVATAILAALAVALAIVGLQQLRRAGGPVPDRTVEYVKEDVEWMRDRIGSEPR